MVAVAGTNFRPLTDAHDEVPHQYCGQGQLGLEGAGQNHRVRWLTHCPCPDCWLKSTEVDVQVAAALAMNLQSRLQSFSDCAHDWCL